MIPPGPRLGDLVIEAEDLRKGYGDRLLIDDLSFRLPPGGIVGVIGANGAGKTTLFRMITGQEQPDGGTLRIGDTVALGYVDQSREALDAEQVGVGGDLGRARPDPARQARDHEPRLRLRLQLQRPRPAEEGRPALGRRAQPGAPRQAAEGRRQRHPARRADQRPRRRHAARARGRAARVRRLRRGDQPRPLVPRPDRDPHAGVRGRSAASSGSRATTRTTRPTANAASAPRPTSRTASSYKPLKVA